nr:MAG TPA: hypothetical protein [Caudoviricetes sp.]
MSGQDWEQLTLFPADSPASPFLLPGSAEARKMTVTSGQKCCGLLRSCSPIGLLGRMLLESSQWRSTRCYLTWKPAGTPQGRLLFRLVPSMPRTAGTGLPLWPTVTKFDATCGDLPGKEYNGESRHAMKLIQAAKLWPTPRANDGEKRGEVSPDPRNGLPGAVRMWPTQSASDCGRTAINPHMTRNGTIRHIGKNGAQSYARLDAVAAMFPTPIATDWKNRGTRASREGREYQLQTHVGGQLNPTWVEWLMGFPTGWTDLDA